MNGPFSLEQLQQALRADLINATAVSVTGVSTDSRQLVSGDLFLAIKGPNFDAHSLVAQAEEKGAVALVVEHQVDSDLPQLIVKDSRLALGDLGAFNRSFFSGSVFAITGSSGKTTVKEMLASINSQRGQTLATLGNLNNEIGVPLTLLRLSTQDQFAVIEMGASGANEIDYSVGLTKPDVALLNNALAAHLEGFGSLEGVVHAKAEIFNGLSAEGVGIINRDDPHYSVWKDILGEQPQLSFGLHPEADVTASEIQRQENGCYQFELHFKGQQQTVQLAMLGRHNVNNALASAATALADNCSLKVISEGLGACKAVPGRMCPIAADNGLLIDDTYNANPGSMKAAVDALLDLASDDALSVLALGDMGELGPDEIEIHADIGRYAAQAGVDVLYTCGPLSANTVAAYRSAGGKQSESYQRHEDVVAAIQQLSNNRVTLAKGSRSARMEQVIKGLQERG
ncbi:UDP-N-acetylmuramoyl-tripeptide--D-alanyl-D-alanine ligase [Aliamphritea ceti]|uniref:UDP-N-acetylmuramoyl-tripeptide--D-alanyl-D- alanine ligase n=1 Tax=Aliamphritea ceti TaxID=1524258 RepID=UPI0021C3AFB0|nr:UDP-N-acetylmuramoyl-tripeptide--D-alanyl-D-alanine ligase [Aliamphritea ceti]